MDLSNQRFGKLTAIHFAGRNKWGQALWEFQCDCGNRITKIPSAVKSGHTSSCGCFNRESTIQRNYNRRTHGLSRTPEFRAWIDMRRRCSNVNRRAYRNYGGRGILVCKGWNTFETFLKDMGYRPSPKHSIDRIDNNGNYCKENCRWATREEQVNNRRNSRLIMYKGKVQSIGKWEKEYNLNPGVVRSRLRRGWLIKRALETAIIKKGRKYA